MFIEFFEDDRKKQWIEQIEKCDWGAAHYLAELLRKNTFMETLGGSGKLYLMIEGNDLVSFVTLTKQDCIADMTMVPWIGFVYTRPEYQGHRYSEKLIYIACKEARKNGYEKVYVATDHIGLYEKYGFTYLENRLDVWGEDSRIYEKSILELSSEIYE